ncbi:beta-N-acetylhexosaminidase, partial [Pseudomonas lundensis]|nr:beta-N-acetylhexosaminidase [Pseudomonas lundensis]
AAIQSIKAGSDIVLVCHEYENEVKVLDALKNAVENGEIPEDRIDQSLYRILKIKKDYGLADEKIEDIEIDKINREMGRILENF